MFVTEPLIYVQLQKTACTHIAQLLAEYVGGEEIAKHGRIPEALRNSEKAIIGSIRNPWDWYVSLWAFGCSGEGDLRRRSQEREILPHLKNLFRHPTGALKNLRSELCKPTTLWADLYRDANDGQRFRQWLWVIFSKKHRHELREGYAYSSISSIAGLLTYRYLRLHCRDISPLYHKTNMTWEQVKAFDQQQNMLQAVIRMEHLEDDFLAVLEQVGYPLTPEQQAAVRDSKKSNTSKHRIFSSYYDAETVQLVSDRERFIIEKYGYHPPILQPSLSSRVV